MTMAIDWYNANAQILTANYDEVSFRDVHGWLLDLLPKPPASILDVGAGSGRDSAWLVAQGYDVVAVEPSVEMMSSARSLHSDSGIQWLSDALPGLDRTLKTGLSFDFILLSAVWMHITPADRTRSFRKLINLLKPGGVLAMTLRHGPVEPDRGMYEVSVAEVEALARDHGAFVEKFIEDQDKLGREDVFWTQHAIRLPDDGTGALPLLRHVILNDDKSSTYKLALLRALCRIADGSAGFAKDSGEEYVEVPLGLVALNWIRLFKPLLAAGLPQSPTNKGYQRLGFVKEGFLNIQAISHLDLRVGMRFTGDFAFALHKALKDAATTISKMPATYMTYPNGTPVLPVERAGRLSNSSEMVLNSSYLSSFGKMFVPRHLWRAMQRFDAWIEPSLVAEWVRLMKGYATRQEVSLDESVIVGAMIWAEPKRDVRLAREQAFRLQEAGNLFCVWSGKRLSERNLDIDHCFPWAAWPCSDLWNLMPAHRSINQNKKRDRLPAEQVLRASRERIVSWWEKGYLTPPGKVIAERFELEAKASLPGLNTATDLEDIFTALSLQRMRLKHDQQVPEWKSL